MEINGQCIINNPLVTQISCDDLGTPDPLDDVIILNVTADSWNNDPAAMFEVIDLQSMATYGPFFYSAGGNLSVIYDPNISLAIQDTQDPNCNSNLISILTHCSNPIDPCASPNNNFVLVGDAISTRNSCYQLTRDNVYLNGGLWYQNALDLNFDFSLSFDLNFGNNDDPGADGMIFTLQTIGNNISGNGGFLGFDNLIPSVGLEFDTFENDGGALDAEDPPEDHMSFQRNGSLVHDNNGYLDNTVPRFILPNIEDGADHTVLIEWNATSTTLSCTFDGNTITVTQDIVNTIFNGNSQVFWGWLAGTGSESNTHVVCVDSLSVVDALSITSSITDVTCIADGAIDITVSGGVPPYTYQWSNGSTMEDLNPVTAGGIYTVTVTDDCGTTTTQDIPVYEEDCCEILGTIKQIECDGMGTADPSDDIITLEVNATNANGGPSNMFRVVNVLDILATFEYGVGGTINVPFNTNITLTFIDQDESSCTDIVSFNPTSCSPPCGTNTLNYVMQGNTTQRSETCYTLTTTNPTYQSGQVWSQNTLDLNNGFAMDFNLNFGNLNDQGADGIMFILQPIGNIPIGNGGSFGFINFPVSAGFEFDTWQNDESAPNFNDPDADHLGFLTNGNLTHPTDPLGNLLNTVLLNDIEDGLPHQVIVTWNPTTMIFSCTIDGVNNVTVTIDLINAIFGGNPNVFWGWSGSTGFAVNNQVVCLNNIQIDQLTMTSVITEITCGAPGQIDITVSGGEAPYIYQWSNGTTNEDLTNITIPGTYTVTVTDYCDQTIINSFVLDPTDCACSITANATQIDCHNMDTSDVSDDLITLEVSATAINPGPTGAFIVWDNASSSSLGTFPYATGGTITVPYSQNLSLSFLDVNDPECTDNIMIDLIPCSIPCTDIRISITLDNYPKETSWDLFNNNGVVIASSNGHLGQNPDGITLDWDFCLDDGCYYFTIYDSYGDGICCDPFYGNGSYTVSNLNTGSIYGQGGQFGYSETVNFCFINGIDETSCPDSLDIPGVNSYVLPGTYEAFKMISSDGIIMEGNVKYSAGKSVYLMSGFEVMDGLEFEAIIEGCEPN